MATPSEIKTGLDEIAAAISEQRTVVEKAIQNAGGASTALAALPTTYSDVISDVNAFTDTGEPWEINAKSELATLTAEFQALKSDADTIAAVVLDT